MAVENETKVTVHDAYALNPADIQEAPTTILGSLKFLGPGMVLSASIVGSGELIATTVLGAQAGFVTLWVILVSCLVKVCVQLEWGKHIINTGEPSMEALNTLPGPKFAGANWSIWAWLILMCLKFLQMGGIVGGVALALNIAVPGINAPIWAWVTAISCSLLVFKGRYKIIEKGSIIMIGMFTVMTFIAVGALQATKYAFSAGDIFSGLTFQLPAAAVTAAIAAFGITGVGGDEIMQYGYWLIEKGYARFTGPKDSSPEWAERAKKWIRVMYVDAFVSMIIYTIMTAAFYVLGASVLHGMAKLPSGYDTMKVLANMYTETLGPGVMWVYVIGGIAVLYSTLFSATAAYSRQFTDCFSQLKFNIVDFHNPEHRKRWVAIAAWLIPTIWALLFLFFKAPVFMVTLGGIGTAIMLLVCVFAAIFFKFRRLDKRLIPGIAYNIFFWISCSAIALLAFRGIYATFVK